MSVTLDVYILYEHEIDVVLFNYKILTLHVGGSGVRDDGHAIASPAADRSPRPKV
jgi:hypothetical protein